MTRRAANDPGAEKVDGDLTGRKPPSRRYVSRILKPLDGIGTLPFALALAAGVGAAAEARSRGSAWPFAVMQGTGAFLGAAGILSKMRRP